MQAYTARRFGWVQAPGFRWVRQAGTEVAIKGFATLYCQASIIRVAKTFDSNLCTKYCIFGWTQACHAVRKISGTPKSSQPALQTFSATTPSILNRFTSNLKYRLIPYHFTFHINHGLQSLRHTINKTIYLLLINPFIPSLSS